MDENKSETLDKNESKRILGRVKMPRMKTGMPQVQLSRVIG